MQNHKTVLSKPGLQLLLLGFITLFLELVLIRYLGANIWNMGYFPNLVLIAVFLGMGLGFVFHQFIPANRSGLLFHLALFVLMILVLFVYYKHPSLPGIREKQTTLAGEVFFLYSPTKGEDTRLAPFLFTFFSTVVIFALLSQRTARLFSNFKPLAAYTLDIAGSCLGIVTFMLVSFLQLPPYLWFAALAAAFVASMSDSWKTRWIPLLPALVILSYSYHFDGKHLRYPDLSGNIEVAWSPYQRVEYIDSPDLPDYLRSTIWVNGMGHQRIGSAEHLKTSIYNMPYQDRQEAGLPTPRNVLIIGAGSGNDTATALMWNVGHVDAVEIDPAIAEIGQRHHPLRPYSDPRVNLVVNDGRAFMANAERKYDIIVFAWADSLVRVSSMSQLRLENFLFTVESMRQAYSLLSDTGTVYVFNSFPRLLIGRKILAMIQRATGVSPVIFNKNAEAFQYFKFGQTKTFQSDLPQNPAVDTPTDDWPFLHLITRAVPPFYLRVLIGMAIFVGLLLVLIHFVTARHAGIREPGMTFVKLAFAMMGAAFLLLETKSVIQFSLLFGATWLNNSLVFLGILLLVLAANWTAHGLRKRNVLPTAFVLLFVSVLLPLWYPLGNLLRVQSVLLRFIAASLLTFSPIFFANLIFSVTFRNQAAPAHVFGWNLIGAMMGGVLEYTSMVLGYNLLAVVVAGCYFLTFLFFRLAKERQSRFRAAHSASI